MYDSDNAHYKEWAGSVTTIFLRTDQNNAQTNVAVFCRTAGQSRLQECPPRPYVPTASKAANEKLPNLICFPQMSPQIHTT